jgi:hypothetical protein
MINTIAKTANQSEIEVLAYDLWERAGHPTNSDLQFWFNAEAQLRTAAKTASGRPAAHKLPLDSKTDTSIKAASVQPGLGRANPAQPEESVPRF